MPLPPCFFLQADVFPRVRAEAARELIAKGWSQTRIAQGLQISQAMVSRYGRAPAESDVLVRRLAEEVLVDLEGGARDESPWCKALGGQQSRPGGKEAMTDILSAEHILRKGVPSGIMPQVGMNIAVALPDARTPRDVLSYPGRLVHADGRLIPPVPPAFGSSGHLSRCLLLLRSRYAQLGAIANVRGGKDVAAAAKGAGTVWHLPGGDADREEQLEDHVTRTRKRPAAIHDPGGFGIEPCLYVVGSDAVAVAEEILRIDRIIHSE